MNARGIYERLRRSYPRWGPMTYKLVLASWLAAAVAIPLVLAGLPFVEFLNDMAVQSKGRTQMTYGRTFGQSIIVARPQVPGTVARDQIRYEFDYLGNELADAQLAGRSLANPVPLTMVNVQRGRSQFNIYCIACHGERAEGNGPAVVTTQLGPKAEQDTGLRFPAPPTLHSDQARGYADGTIFHIITKGTGKMRSYADKLEPADRWKVIHYVRALQLSMIPPPATSQSEKP